MAFRALQGHFFQTFLSILGMIIGVAALVGILCLIDGMEQFAKDQISQTTSLKSIVVTSRTTKSENGVILKKDTFAYITPKKFIALQNDITFKTSYAYLISTQSNEASYAPTNKKIISLLNGVTAITHNKDKIVAGSPLSEADILEKRKVVVANKLFVKLISPSDSTHTKIGSKLIIRGEEFELIGIVNQNSQSPELFVPITHFSDTDLKDYPPTAIIEVEEIDQVGAAKEFITQWLRKEYGAQKNFDVMTNGFRVEQAEQGFRLFRVIMGLIVGISVLVGGVGVMNVMLISVTQRTTEIGVRKALGAKRSDIMYQFLAESISISTMGSICGLVLGVLGTMATIPIIKAITKIPFQASYTWNTIILVAIIAVVVGIVFGTYPALRASRLDPVEAMRRE